MPEMKDQLAQILGANSVLDDDAALQSWASDESFVHPLKPRLAVKVKNGKEVQSVVRWANQSATPLVPISSGGPHLRGDTVPSVPGALMVDLSGMNKIVHIDTRNRMVLIEPGVTHLQLQTELAKAGLRLSMPLLPRSNKSVLTSLLEREPRLTPRLQWSLLEPLRALEVTWGDGNLMTTGDAGSTDQLEEEWKKGFAQIVGSGPAQTDFYKMVSAAQGSMGIVSWASVKCEVLPQAQRMYLVASERLEPLIDLCYAILRIRFGDELFILNRQSLATILEKSVGQIPALAARLPAWILAAGIAGRDRFPRERIAYQEKDIAALAGDRGLKLQAELPAAGGAALLAAVNQPSHDPDWRKASKGASEEIFFLSTLEKAPQFVQAVDSLASSQNYPADQVSVYIQPVHQGAGAHIEFSFPYDRRNPAELARMKQFSALGSEALLREGAYYSRPYGSWAALAFNRDYRTTEVLKKIKGIFDPRNILNPGKLCF